MRDARGLVHVLTEDELWSSKHPRHASEAYIEEATPVNGPVTCLWCAATN